jgi:hypothetical protein
MGRCNMCMPGGKSNGCINMASGVGIPSVSLAQKVTTSFSLSLCVFGQRLFL